MSSLRESLGLQPFGLWRKNLSADAKAAVVLGVESVPDGLASGILAGVRLGRLAAEARYGL